MREQIAPDLQTTGPLITTTELEMQTDLPEISPNEAFEDAHRPEWFVSMDIKHPRPA